MTWLDLINEESKKKYYQDLMMFVNEQYQTKSCNPLYSQIFSALDLTSFDNVKVVIIGQDPYPTKGVAMGLAFSVNEKVKIPKSLHNMFLELSDDLGFPYPSNGDLTSWAKNGVLLLNRILTGEEGKPLSHQNKGWEIFTLRIIKELNKVNKKMVFILLGNVAKSIIGELDNPNHLIIVAPHPSPLSAYHGFFGSKIYSRTCSYLNLPKDFWRLS